MEPASYSISLHGSQLYGQVWQPESPLAVLVLVHGHGEHSGRYAPMAAFLQAAGIATVALDQFGHGKTTGKKGHCPSYEAMLDSIEAQLGEAKKRFPGLPLFLMGHSMGGNLVANYVLKRGASLQGVVLSSPWFRLALKPSAGQLLIGKIARVLAPAFTQSTRLDATAISRLPEEVARYKNDPLNHDLISPTMFFGLIEGEELIEAEADSWSLPLLAYHGSGDRLTSFAATRDFTARIPGDATFVAKDGGFHELHYDKCREEIYDLLKIWLTSHATR